MIPWPVFMSTIWIAIGTLIIVIRMILEMIEVTINLRKAGIRSNIFNFGEDEEIDEIEQNII